MSTPENLALDGAIFERLELRFAPLEEFASIDEPGAEPLAATPDGGVVIPAGGVVIVYGSGGAGKTTLVGDLSIHLGSGKPWLGLVAADRPLRVALIENEGPRAEFRRKLRAKLAATDLELDGRVVVLEEPWAELTLADETHRRGLAAAIVELEADLLVLGPLVSAGEFPTGGTPDEIRRFEEHVADLRRLAGRSFALLLVHHENRAGQVSGAWERFPDTLLHVTPQGNGRTRIFWQKARWASTLHGTSTTLLWADGETYTIDSTPELTEDTMCADLLGAVLANPGASWTKLRDLHDDRGTKVVRGRGKDLTALRDRLIADGALVNVAPREGQFVLWHSDDPACPRSGVGTARERLTFPASPEESGADPFPVPTYKGNGRNGNGPDEPTLAVDDDATAVPGGMGQ